MKRDGPGNTQIVCASQSLQQPQQKHTQNSNSILSTIKGLQGRASWKV
jgi:hypothetical protein